MNGFFLGAVVTTAVMLMLYFAGQFSSLLGTLHALQQVLLTIVISLIALNSKPLALKTIWVNRRDTFVLDEDLNATLRGRTFGIPAGIVLGMLIQNQL
jgi:hypothetical protein